MASGQHTVEICLAGNTAGTIDALDITVLYDNALNAGTELGGTGATCDTTVGSNCVDDNPNLNEGTSPGQLGTGWSCGAFGTTQPRGDGTLAGGDASMQCHSLTGASAQNGLLATVTFNVAGHGVDLLRFGLNRQGAATGLSLSGSGVFECAGLPSGNGLLTCAGATIRKRDGLDPFITSSTATAVPAIPS